MTPPPANPNSFPVVIIGSGIAGLSAALHLAERGLTPLILEADSQYPGGRLSGGEPDEFDYGGRHWSFPSEHGIHALAGPYDNTRAMFDRFLDIELRSSGHEDWIMRWGRRIEIQEAGSAMRWGWIPAPFHYLYLLMRPATWSTITPLEWMSLPGFLFSIFMTIGFDPLAERSALDGMTIDDYFLMWTPKLRATFSGLLNNLMAAPDESISLTGLIAAVRFYSLLRRDAWWLEYLPGNSHHSLIAPLLERIKVQGGALMLGARARTLSKSGDHWRIRVEDAQRGGMRTVLARHIILAVDAPAARRLLDASPDTAQLASSLKIPGAMKTLTARLWFDRAPAQGAPSGMLTGDFTFNNFFWLHRLHTEFEEWHTLTGGSMLELHLYAPDRVLDQPEKILLTQALNEVQLAFPAMRGHFVYGAIRHNDRTQTRFRVPTRNSLHVETPWPGIFACGDWIGYSTPAMWIERCCITAIAAANHVLSANDLPPFAIIPARKAEPLVLILGAVVHMLRLLFAPLVLIGRFLRRIT